MTRTLTRVTPLLALLAAVVGALAVSMAPAAAQETVAVSLTEFVIGVDQGSAVEGQVTFRASNNGTIPHDLRVIRTGLAPGSLPMNEAAFMVDEGGLNVVASSAPLTTGQTTDVAANLAPGSYVLICNIPTHYQAGMWLGFQVRGASVSPTSGPADDVPDASVTPNAGDVSAPPATGQGPGERSVWSWWPLTIGALAGTGIVVLLAGAAAYRRGRQQR